MHRCSLAGGSLEAVGEESARPRQRGGNRAVWSDNCKSLSVLPERVLGRREKAPTCRLRPRSAGSPVPWLPSSPLGCRIGSGVAPSKGWPLSLPLPLSAHLLPFALSFSVWVAVPTAASSYSAPMCLACLLELKLLELLPSVRRARYSSVVSSSSQYLIRQMLRYRKTAYSRLPVSQQVFPSHKVCGAGLGQAALTMFSGARRILGNRE